MGVWVGRIYFHGLLILRLRIQILATLSPSQEIRPTHMRQQIGFSSTAGACNSSIQYRSEFIHNIGEGLVLRDPDIFQPFHGEILLSLARLEPFLAELARKLGQFPTRLRSLEGLFETGPGRVIISSILLKFADLGKLCDLPLPLANFRDELGKLIQRKDQRKDGTNAAYPLQKHFNSTA